MRKVKINLALKIRQDFIPCKFECSTIDQAIAMVRRFREVFYNEAGVYNPTENESQDHDQFVNGQTYPTGRKKYQLLQHKEHKTVIQPQDHSQQAANICSEMEQLIYPNREPPASIQDASEEARESAEHFIQILDEQDLDIGVAQHFVDSFYNMLIELAEEAQNEDTFELHP